MISQLKVPEEIIKHLSDRARWEDMPPTGAVTVGSMKGWIETSTLTSISWLPWNQTQRKAK